MPGFSNGTLTCARLPALPGNVVCGRTRTCNLRALYPVELYAIGTRPTTGLEPASYRRSIQLSSTQTFCLVSTSYDLSPARGSRFANQCAGLSPPVALSSREARVDRPCNDLSKRLTRLSGRRSRRMVSNDEHDINQTRLRRRVHDRNDGVQGYLSYLGSLRSPERTR